MANKIITKNSSTAGAVPTAVDLVTGELAVNVTDKRLFTENASGTIVELGTNPSELNFKDNAKANFGNGSDLQIYHTGSHSWVQDAGTGNLYVAGDNLWLTNSDNTKQFLKGDSTGRVDLYYNTSVKLATTDTGIDVTGTVVADEVGIGTSSPSRTLHVDAGSSDIVALFESSDSPASISFYDGTGGTNINSSGNEIYFRTGSTATGSGGNERVRINSNGAVLVGGTNAASAHGLDDIGSLFLQSQTNNANIGLSIYVNEGANNRRASFFVDDSLGVYGVEGTATSSIPDFVIRRAGNELARFTVDGLTFNGDTAAANALDDYEEGSFTPGIEDSSANVASTGGTYGYYVKIGRSCTIWINVNNIDTTGLVAGDDFRVTGLPFAATSVVGTLYMSGAGTITNCSSTNTLIPSIIDSTQYIKFLERVPGNVNDFVVVSELTDDTSDLWATITYYTTT